MTSVQKGGAATFHRIKGDLCTLSGSLAIILWTCREEGTPGFAAESKET